MQPANPSICGLLHLSVMAEGKSLVLFEDDPEVVQEMRRRQEEAEELEKKLKVIQETVPTRIFNVCGSSAGAGSGDFHQYRMIRRREQARLKMIEEEAAEADETDRKRRKYAMLKVMGEKRTEKKRNRRLKEKMKKKAKRGHNTPLQSADPQPTESAEQITQMVLPEQVELD